MTSTYTVVAIARSGVIIRQEDSPVLIDALPVAGRRVDIRLFTRYDEEEFGVSIPRELMAEVSGPADSIDEARRKFTQIADSIFGLLSVSANSYISNAVAFLAFEVSSGAIRREFVQDFVDWEKGPPSSSKYLRVAESLQLLRAITGSAERLRLQRAVVSYRLALRDLDDSDILTVAYAFVAAEALKVSALRTELEHRTEEQLVADWNVPARAQDGSVRRGDLEAAARKYSVFQGDTATHNAAADARNKFQHGLAGFDEIHEFASASKTESLRYVREAIVRLSKVSNEVADVLLESPLSLPTGDLRIQHVLAATLVGRSDTVAPGEWPYPRFERDAQVQISINDEGAYHMEFTGEGRAILPPGVVAENVLFGMRRPPDPTGRLEPGTSLDEE